MGLATLLRFFVFASTTLCSQFAMAQSLAPRAYVIAPVNSNAVTVSWSFYDGGVNVNGTVPISGATGTYQVPVLSYYHSFNLFGRFANVTAFVPYGVGTFSGAVEGRNEEVYRSGLLDAGIRFSVNLKGGAAMKVPEFVKWRQKRLLGVSLTVIAPTGQYDPRHLVNWGINRWAFRPELGYSRRWRNWVLDAYGGVWFYTMNKSAFSIPAPEPQTEGPIESIESHLSYDFNKFLRCWVSLDGNFWFGGTTTLNDISNSATRQTNSYVGATASFPYSRHQSVKVSYATGVYARFGGDYQTVAVAWQYSWIGWKN